MRGLYWKLLKSYLVYDNEAIPVCSLILRKSLRENNKKNQHCWYPSTHTYIQRPNWNNFWQKTTCICDKALSNWALFISNEDTSQEEVCSYVTLSKLAVLRTDVGNHYNCKIKNTAQVLALTSSALINTYKKWQPRHIWSFTVKFLCKRPMQIKHEANGKMILNFKIEQYKSNICDL